VDRKLERILKKVMKIVDIKICGVDMFKRDGKWLLIEVNSQPSLDFFEEEREKLTETVLNILIKGAEEN
jgi:glutathione synthase/RimK-type ligase-like ATP-grasp enzyme